MEATLKDRIKQFVIDGEAVVLGVDGTAPASARAMPSRLGRSVERSVERSYYPMGTCGIFWRCRSQAIGLRFAVRPMPTWIEAIRNHRRSVSGAFKRTAK